MAEKEILKWYILVQADINLKSIVYFQYNNNHLYGVSNFKWLSLQIHQTLWLLHYKALYSCIVSSQIKYLSS